MTTSLEAALAGELRDLERAGLRRTLRPLERRQGARVADGARTLIDFSSNDYLGLASDPRVASAAIAALRESGTGGAAARLISGHHPLHAQLEQAVAAFLGTESALLFASGYLANTGAIPALVGRGDAIYSDAANHASLIDGCRLSRAEVHVVPHASPDALEQALAATGGRYRRRLIVVEGIYSMDGDLYPLDALPPLADRYDAWTYVDDAHGFGVLGPTGRGAIEHWDRGVGDRIDVRMGTLGKAFGTAGAFIGGSRPLIDLLVNRARAFVFTTASPPALAAGSLAALAIAQDEPARRASVRTNAQRLRCGLASQGRPVKGPEHGHIVPVLLGSNDLTMQVGEVLRAAGFLVGAVRPPTVAPGTARLRITVSAAHTADDIDGLLHTLQDSLPLSA